LSVIAAVVLGSAISARSQKAPVEPNAAKTVELKERELADQADSRLRGKWAAHLKSRATVQATKAPTANNSAPLPKIGSVAPDFILPDAEGRKHWLHEFGGKPTVLFFFKGYGCLHCTRQVTAFSDAYQLFAKKGIQVIRVTSDSVESLKDASQSYSCPFPLLADPEGVVFAQFGCVSAGGVRHGTFSLDAKGQITWRTVGSSPYLGINDLLENALLSVSAENGSQPSSGVIALGTK